MSEEFAIIGDVSKLLESLQKAKTEFVGLDKDAMGQVGHTKFKYMPLGTIDKAIRQSLSNNGVAVVQPLSSVDNKNCTINTILSGHGGMIVSRFSFDRGDKGPQEFGKLCTYNRRYCLQSLLVLEGDDDVDAAKSEVKHSQSENKTEKTKSENIEQEKSNPVETKEIKSNVVSQSESDINAHLMAEKHRLNWTSQDLTKECHALLGVNPAQSNLDQRKQFLEYMKGKPTP